MKRKIDDRSAIVDSVPKKTPSLTRLLAPEQPMPTPNPKSAQTLNSARAGHGFSSSGRPLANGAAAKKALPGNARRAHRQSSLGRCRRPSRSFPQEAALPPLRTMLPLEEMHRAGAICTPGIGADLNALPKAGVGIPESREGRTRDR